jgi:hypothetical protein
LIWKVYGRYLKANRQPQGIVTYSEVTAWLMAYAEKFGRESIRGRTVGPQSRELPKWGQRF